jgi:hypothetical protein
LFGGGNREELKTMNKEEITAKKEEVQKKFNETMLQMNMVKDELLRLQGEFRILEEMEKKLTPTE